MTISSVTHPTKPRTEVVEQLQISVQLRLWKGPDVLHHYIWTCVGPGLVTYRTLVIFLHQADTEIHWVIASMRDVSAIVQQELRII